MNRNIKQIYFLNAKKFWVSGTYAQSMRDQLQALINYKNWEKEMIGVFASKI